MSPIDQLTDDELRVEVAKLCGWHDCYRASAAGLMGFYQDRGVSAELPNYPSDLNACAEFEKTLSLREYWEYADIHLVDVVFEDNRARNATIDATSPRCATARQRCIAFLKVKGVL